MKRVHLAALLALVSIIITISAPARADLMELKWASEGYFRTRTVLLTNLAPQDRLIFDHPSLDDDLIIPDVRRTSYITSRLRVMPTLKFEKLASLHFQIDAIDDVLWGDNNGLASAPLFATDASSQHFLGGEVGDSVKISRAWVQFQIPVGLMRVGRQPSHWGMGLLANGGGTGRIDTLTPPPPGKPDRRAHDYFFDDDFGDNHFGSTADRILFITKPITIAKTIMKANRKESNLLVGYAFDKLSEAPWLPAESLERRFRPFGQQGFISRGKNDDINEHVVLAVYSLPDWDQVRYTDQLKIGFYGVMRSAKEGSTYPSDPDLGNLRKDCSGRTVTPAVPRDEDPGWVDCIDTGSKVWIADFWYKVRYGPWYSEAEVLMIGGSTFGGIPFPGKNKQKKASITAGAGRFGYLTEKWDAILEVGHARGDDDMGDEVLKQRATHPDYNVGLILFEEILREQTARTYFLGLANSESPQGAQGFMSQGGVINANYLHPKGRWRPGIGGLEVVGALLFAWADELPRTGVSFLPYKDQNTGSYLGTEADIAIKTSFSGKMIFSLESGILFFGDALKAVLPNANSSFTLQSRLAFMW